MTDGWHTGLACDARSDRRSPVPDRGWLPIRVELGATSEAGEWELPQGELPPDAAHVVSSRFGYTHHGIHVGNGRVIHYSGLSHGWRRGPVEEVSLAEFGRGRSIRVRVHSRPRFDRESVIARAQSRLGENRYRTLSNNCEHLCTWCIYGENSSRQVEALRSALLLVLQRVRGLVGAPLRLRSFAWPSMRREGASCDAC